MASIKDLKKDINFLAEEVVQTCFLHQHIRQNDPKVKEEIDAMIEEILNLREELIYKIQHPDESSDKKTSKKYYREIWEQMLEKTEKSFEKLGEIGQ